MKFNIEISQNDNIMTIQDVNVINMDLLYEFQDFIKEYGNSIELSKDNLKDGNKLSKSHVSINIENLNLLKEIKCN